MGTKIKNNETIKDVGYNLNGRIYTSKVVVSKSGKKYAPILKDGTRGKFTTENKAIGRSKTIKRRILKDREKTKKRLAKNPETPQQKKKRVEEYKKAPKEPDMIN